MKKILFLFVAAIACICLTAAKPAKEGPQIEFEAKNHDFGTVGAEGGPVTHVFTFTNTGTQPLIVLSATASCGCTKPEYTTDPVKPGKKGKIKVTYLPSGQPLGEFNKTVRVRTNASGRRTTLQICGAIVPGTKKPEHP